MVRAAAAFAISLLLSAVAVRAGWSQRYWNAVADIGREIQGNAQHFQGLPKISTPTYRGRTSHLPLVLALFLISWRLPLRQRGRLFGLLAGLCIAQDVLAACLATTLHDARELFEHHRLLVLLPQEYNTLELGWYAVYVIPLQAGPFLLLLLAAFCNLRSGRSASAEKGLGVKELIKDHSTPGPTPRRGLFGILLIPACVAVILVFGWVGASLWGDWREGDPLHQRTHSELGRLRLSEGNFSAAEAEFRHATKRPPGDVQAWLGLARVLLIREEREQAILVLREALEVVADPRCQERIQGELEAMGGTDPHHPLPIVAVEPRGRP